MKTILGSKRHHYVARVSIFLIMVALIAGVVGCGGESYALAITSTAGGSVSIPGEGISIYSPGTVVNLTAEAEEGYYFVKWTGDVGTISDANAVETTITMNGHYSITANFVPDGVEPLWDWYDLDDIRNNLNGSYLLMNDLDSNTAGYTELASPTANQGKGWESIGNVTESLDVGLFAGIFDGQDYKIRDFFINRPDELAVGLFNCVGEGGVVEKLGVVSANVSGGEGVGALVGLNCGNVSNCYSGGSVSGFGTGGLVGVNAGHVNNCHSTAAIVASGWYAGGLVGGNCGPYLCPQELGDGVVSNSYATGNVSGNEGVGGLVGMNGDAVSNCYATGSVTGNHQVGGLVGGNEEGPVSNSYSTGSVTGNLSVGGLVGVNGGRPVSNSYSTGSVTGNSCVGGLVGANWGPVSNSYSTGSVTGNSSVGGLVGVNGGPVSNSFWDTDTSGLEESDGGIGKTTDEMQDIDTFTDTETEGLDEPWNIILVDNPGIRNLSYTWNIVDDETYPFLSWQPVS